MVNFICFLAFIIFLWPLILRICKQEFEIKYQEKQNPQSACDDSLSIHLLFLKAQQPY